HFPSGYRREQGMVPIIIAEEYQIPAGIVDLQAFRRWACSDDFPEHGRFSYLAGEIWVDPSMEQLYTHNRVKTRMAAVLDNVAEQTGLGDYFSDGALLSNLDVDLSTVPDGLLVSYDAVRDLRVRLTEGARKGYVEVVGTPDMVLEVVSDNSV